MKEPSLRCQRRDGPLLEKREKWGTPVSDWSELRDEPHNHRTLGEGGHPPSPKNSCQPNTKSLTAKKRKQRIIKKRQESSRKTSLLPG
jgi:hypothetical protein